MIKSISSYLSFRNIGLILMVALIYYISARAGLLLAYKNTNATPVWPPSGIALAALLLFGYRIIPGIILGDLAVNLIVFHTNNTLDLPKAISSSSIISIGSTSEAVIGYYLLKKSIENISTLGKVKHVFQFTAIAFVICMVSSTVGATVVCFSEIVSWNEFPTVWRNWWLGDISGILIFTPLLLAWANSFNIKWNSNKKVTETSIMFFLIVFTTWIIFGNWLPSNSPFIRAYLIVPLLLLAAFRFEFRTVVTAIAISSIIAIMGTANGYGPFIYTSSTESLFSLQLYISITTLCIFTLKAALNERENAGIALQTAHNQLLQNSSQRSEELSDFQTRINTIFNTLLKFTVLDFSEKTPISERGDEIDAVAYGLNTLGDELVSSRAKHTEYATDLENANYLLKNSEQQTQNIFDNAPDAVILIDSESKVNKWNPQAENIFGWKANEVIGKPLSEFMIPARYREAHKKGLRHFLKSAIDSAVNKYVEIKVINREGLEFPVSLSISSLKMDEKYFFIGFIRDITKTRIAESKINELATIVESSEDAIYSVSAERNILTWNKGAEKVYGFSAAEAIGKSVSIFTPPQQMIELTSLREKLLNGELNKNLETERVRKDGRRIYVSNSPSAILNNAGVFKGISIISRDITEQRIAESKINELASIVESSEDAIFSVSADSTILTWNKGAEKMYGFTAGEAVGKSNSIITPPQQLIEITGLKEKIKNGEPVANYETERVKKDGSKIQISITASPHKNFSGETIAYSIISRDITEKKKMETEILKMTEELKRSNTELEQFAYVASHDLQEPLRMVSSFLQLLQNRYKDELDQEANEFIGFAVDGSNRMKNLILSLLEYSRINRVNPFKEIDVNSLLHDLLRNYYNAIKENNAIININELPKIYGDPLLINQLFQNLIDNALKFRNGENPEITISCETVNDDYLFSVKDNGIGIEKAYMDKIFVLFQRLNSKEKYPGTGIGLAICKKIVERHGGKIWIESETGKGSTFYFTIKNKKTNII